MFHRLIILFLVISTATKTDQLPIAKNQPLIKINNSTCDTVYTTGDILPCYKNGTTDIVDFVFREVTPLLSPYNQKNGGLVTSLKIELTIGKNGKVVDFNTFKELESTLLQNLKDLFFTMDFWNPGEIDHQAVCMRIILPIKCIKWE